MTFILLTLATLVIAVLLAVENAAAVTVNLLAWQLEASLAVIIVLCFALGALGALLAMLPHLRRSRHDERLLRVRVAELEEAKRNDRATPSSAKDLPPAAAPIL